MKIQPASSLPRPVPAGAEAHLVHEAIMGAPRPPLHKSALWISRDAGGGRKTVEKRNYTKGVADGEEAVADGKT